VSTHQSSSGNLNANEDQQQLEKKPEGRAESDVAADASSAVGTNTNLSRREETHAREDNDSSVAPGTFCSVVEINIALT
jgi:hypothetical protein